MCAAATTRTAECGRANPVFWDERAEAGTSDASKPFFLPERVHRAVGFNVKANVRSANSIPSESSPVKKMREGRPLRAFSRTTCVEICF
jgi:hypothetical protein